MKENLVPICVKLLKKSDGSVGWPDLNTVPSNILKGSKWSQYIDTHGIGWIYDKVENLGTGHSFGRAATLVPLDFAQSAVGLFPDLVEIWTEEIFEEFHDQRTTLEQAEDTLDTVELQGIVARIQLEKELGIDPSPELIQRRKDALDRDHPQRGVNNNHKNKYWIIKKSSLSISIHPDYKKT